MGLFSWVSKVISLLLGIIIPFISSYGHPKTNMSIMSSVFRRLPSKGNFIVFPSWLWTGPFAVIFRGLHLNPSLQKMRIPFKVTKSPKERKGESLQNTAMICRGWVFKLWSGRWCWESPPKMVVSGRPTLVKCHSLSHSFIHTELWTPLLQKSKTALLWQSKHVRS